MKTFREFLTESIPAGAWYRGVNSEKDVHKPSAVHVTNDNMLADRLNYNADEEGPYPEHEHHANVTKDRDNAKGYGKHVYWVHPSAVHDFGHGYGSVHVNHFDVKDKDKTWGKVKD